MRIVQVSDPHLSPRRADTAEGFERVVRWLNADPPDLVVLTGDMAEDDPDSPAERQFAYQLVNTIVAPLLTLPGNHDVGENGVTAWNGPLVTDDRVAAYVETWGSDRWVLERDGWRLVGANLITPDPLSAVAWLGQQLLDDRPTTVFLHKPVFLVAPEVVDEPGGSAEPGWRAALLDVLRPAPVKVVASGHLHAFRTHALFEGCTALWAPSTSITGHERGHGSVLDPGVVEYWFDADGWRAAYRPLADCRP